MADAWTRAEGALAKGDRDGALTALIEAWRAERATELAAIIDVVSDDAARGRLPIADGKDLHERWMAIEAEGSIADVPRLGPGLHAEPVATLGLRIERLVARGADPRTGRALMGLIEAIPTTSSSNFPIWTRAFKAMPDMLDRTDAKKLAAYRKRKPKTTSNFWPKLDAWLEKLIDALPEPAKLDAGKTKRAAKMLVQAKALAKEPAKAPRSTKKPVRAAFDEDEETALAAAADALAKNDLVTAVERVRQAWDRAPRAEIAALLDAVSTAAPQETLPGDPPKAVHAAWLALEAKGRASDVPALLERLETGPFADVEVRLARLLARPRDPRLATHARQLVFEGKAGGEKRVYWKTVFDLMARGGGATELDVAAKLGRNEPAVIGRGNLAFGNGPLLRSNGRRVADELAARITRESDIETARVRSLDHAIAAVKKAIAKPKESPERAMIDAIVGAGDDDGPRLVYADWLIEQRDPLGELIVVQCRLAGGSLTAAEEKKLRAREKVLLKARNDLLGPLAEIIWKGSERFERGMLVAMAVDLKSERRRKLLEHPRLATVRDLSLAWTRDDSQAAVVTHPNLVSVRSIASVDTPGLVAIVAGSRELPCEELEMSISLDLIDPAAQKAIANATNLPRLRVLHTTFWEGDGLMPDWMMNGAIYGNLDRLIIGSVHSGQCPNIVGWLAATRKRKKRPALMLRWSNGDATVDGNKVLATFRWPSPVWTAALRAAREHCELVLDGEWPAKEKAAVMK